nr:MAG TPA: hyaluronidase [Bacteriophage sp.]
MTYLKTKDTVYNYDKIYYVNYDNFIYRLLVNRKTSQGYLFYCDGTFYTLCNINFNDMNVTYKDVILDILEAEVDTNGAFRFLGEVSSFEKLPKTANNGDIYQVPPDKEYVWNGEKWILLGFNMDLSNYATKDYVKAQDKINADNIALNTEGIKANEELITNEITERKSAIEQTKTLVINLTENNNEGKYTSDKDYTAIKEAYDKGRPIVVKLNEAQLPLMNAEINSTSAGFTFGYTEVKYGGEYVTTRAIHYLHTTDSDTWEDNDKTGYYVKLEEVGQGLQVSSNLNMGEHSISNIQKLHIDGTAPLYIGQVIETQDINKPRLTGVVNSNAAAFVKSDKQSEYVPVFVGTPSDNNHAATKKYVDDNKGLSSTGGNITGDLSIGGKLSVTGIASCTTAPTQGVDLCNKQYVDGKFGSIFNYDAETRTLTITTT